MGDLQESLSDKPDLIGLQVVGVAPAHHDVFHLGMGRNVGKRLLPPFPVHAQVDLAGTVYAESTL